PLSPQQLRLFACGSYQIKVAPSYVAEHLHSHDTGYEIRVAKEDISLDFEDYGIDLDQTVVHLLHARIQSCHQSRKTYNVFILIDTTADGIAAIAEHYCTCKIGL